MGLGRMLGPLVVELYFSHWEWSYMLGPGGGVICYALVVELYARPWSCARPPDGGVVCGPPGGGVVCGAPLVVEL